MTAGRLTNGDVQMVGTTMNIGRAIPDIIHTITHIVIPITDTIRTDTLTRRTKIAIKSTNHSNNTRQGHVITIRNPMASPITNMTKTTVEVLHRTNVDIIITTIVIMATNRMVFNLPEVASAHSVPERLTTILQQNIASERF